MSKENAIEAAKKSGALLTANHAINQGKLLYALPGRIGELTSEGTNNLIRKGCPAALCCGDVLKALEPETDGQQEEKPKKKATTPFRTI